MFKIELRNNGVPEGNAAQFFSKLPPTLDIPAPIRMLTASPGYMEVQLNQIKYFARHDTLSAPLAASIRLLAARAFDLPACVEFNTNLLKAMGMAEDEIAAMCADPNEGALEEIEKGLLAFVIKGLVDPSACTQADVDDLRRMGWTDADILDCVMLGAGMKAAGTALKILEADPQ